MAKVTGLGGIFYKVADTAATQAWYREDLGARVRLRQSWNGKPAHTCKNDQ